MSIQSNLRFARTYLADLYEDARQEAADNPSRVGAWTVANQISDAIDRIDTAINAAGAEVQTVPDDNERTS